MSTIEIQSINSVLVDGVGYGSPADVIANNPAIAPAVQIVLSEYVEAIRSAAAAAAGINGVDLGMFPEMENAVPSSVSRKQLLIALALYHGIRQADIQAKIELIYTAPDSIDRYVAECHLEDSQTFERNHALIDLVAQTFSLATAQVDELFRKAAKLQ